MEELFKGLDKSIVQWLVYYLLTAITGYLAVKLKGIKKEMEANKKEAEVRSAAQSEALQSLLRNELIKTYNHYTEKGYLPIHERDNVSHMYQNYTVLKGNGTIPRLMEELFSLPVNPCK